MRISRGFTLLELLITLVVAGIMLTFVVPSFTSLGTRHLLNTSAEDLRQGFQMARMEAIKRNGSVRFCAVSSEDPLNGDSCLTDKTAVWPRWAIMDGRTGEVLYTSGDLDKRLKIFSTETVFTYRSDGLAHKGAGLAGSVQVTLCSKGNGSDVNARRLSVDAGLAGDIVAVGVDCGI